MRDHRAARLGRARRPGARPARRRPVDALLRARRRATRQPQYRQLDYLLLSRALDARRVGPPDDRAVGAGPQRDPLPGRAPGRRRPATVRTPPTTARPSWSSTCPRAPVREITDARRARSAYLAAPPVRRRRGGDPVAAARAGRRRAAAAPAPRRRVPLRVHGGRRRPRPARRGRAPRCSRASATCRSTRTAARSTPPADLFAGFDAERSVLVLRHARRADLRVLARDGRPARRLDRRRAGPPAARPLDLRRARRVPRGRRPRRRAPSR